MNKKYFVFVLASIFAASGVAAHAEEGRGSFREEERGRPEMRESRGFMGTGTRERFDDRKENRGPRGPEMNGKAFVGNVLSVSGNTFQLRLIDRSEQSATGTVFTVDATNAKIVSGPVLGGGSSATNTATSSVSQIKAGMRVLINGTVNGQTVTARNIHLDVPLRALERREDRREDRKEDRKEERKENKKPKAPVLDITKIGDGQPVVVGTVGTTTGSSFTLKNKSNVIYTIDAANAKIFIRNATGTIADVKQGDQVAVQGAVSGTSITASTVLDQGVVALKKIDEKTGMVKKNVFEKMGSFFRNLF